MTRSLPLPVLYFVAAVSEAAPRATYSGFSHSLVSDRVAGASFNFGLTLVTSAGLRSDLSN
jgi:hypothetical protein